MVYKELTPMRKDQVDFQMPQRVFPDEVTDEARSSRKDESSGQRDADTRNVGIVHGHAAIAHSCTVGAKNSDADLE
jgi:hypothetical protein